MAKETIEVILARIDERQKQMNVDIEEIKKNMNGNVKNDDNFKDMCSKVKTLWDERNKLIGWMMGAGLVGGVTGSFLKNLVGSVFALIKN